MFLEQKVIMTYNIFNKTIDVEDFLFTVWSSVMMDNLIDNLWNIV